MLKMTRRIGRLSGLIAAGVAIVGTGSGVMAASYSAFSATTANGANNWNTGTVVLNNDASGAMFTGTGAANQQMNATGTQCIKVTSTGNLPTTVKLYSTSFSNTNSLATHVVLTVSMGTGGSNSSCTGFSGSSIYTGTLAGFNTAYPTDYSHGLAVGWTPTGTASESKTFQFVWSYDSTTPQNSTASDTFTWEAQGS